MLDWEWIETADSELVDTLHVEWVWTEAEAGAEVTAYRMRARNFLLMGVGLWF